MTTFCSAAATCHCQVFNPHEGTQFQRSDDESVKAFRYVLTRAGTGYCEYSFDKLLPLWRPAEVTLAYLPRPDKAPSDSERGGQLFNVSTSQGAPSCVPADSHRTCAAWPCFAPTSLPRLPPFIRFRQTFEAIHTHLLSHFASGWLRRQRLSPPLYPRRL